MFKVYKRKIHVYFKHPNGFVYAWSTNAYPTCKAALKAAQELYPERSFKANFDKG